jgi:hypothetical protein
MEQQEVTTKATRYLCMSYNKYIIMRNKLSDACTKNKSDSELREKLMNFIRLHPDHEMKRQTQAMNNTSNPSHKEMHNAKIADLSDQAYQMYEKREAYKKIRESEADVRLATHTARMVEEKARALANKNLKIEKAKEYNLNKITVQKANGEAIRLSRDEKKKAKAL